MRIVLKKAKGVTSISAQAQHKKLVQKLFREGISKSDASGWRVVPRTFKRYIYTHPKLPGHFLGLTAAKHGHLASVAAAHAGKLEKAKAKAPAPPIIYESNAGSSKKLKHKPKQSKLHITLPAGTSKALARLSRAEWRGVDSSGNKHPVFSSAIRSKVDVILADPQSFRHMRTANLDGQYHMAGLVANHGFLRVQRPSVVISKDTDLIMGVFLNAAVLPQLTSVVGKLPTLHSILSKRMAPCKRKGLFMFGYRYNQQRDCHRQSSLNLLTGYYCCNTLEDAVHLWRDPVAKDVIVSVASDICNLERIVSPAMAEKRMQHAVTSGHPGIFPGYSVNKSPTPCLAVSKGYRSKFHQDYGHRDMSESIVFSSRGVRRRSGYSFAIGDAGIVFDLIAGGDASLVMVPGSVWHGTPGLNPKFEGKHPGIGAVVIGKENLLREDALKDTKWTCARLDEGNTCNPFVAKFAIQKELACERCPSLASKPSNPMFACDECNDGYHVKCLASVALPEMGQKWFCPTCSPLVKEAVQMYPLS